MKQYSFLQEFVGHTVGFGAGAMAYAPIAGKMHKVAEKRYSDYLRKNPEAINSEIDFCIKDLTNKIGYLKYNSDEVIEADGPENYKDYVNDCKSDLIQFKQLKTSNDIELAISKLCNYNRHNKKSNLYKKVASFYDNPVVDLGGATLGGIAGTTGYHFAKKGIKKLLKK